MKTKICGIRSLEDAECAIRYGAWAIGFNFYPSSPRYVTLKEARSIFQNLSNRILKVGVIPNLTRNEAMYFMTKVGLDLLQVYEDIDMEPSFKKNMILSVSDDLPGNEILEQYGYILLDAAPLTDGRVGGTGRLSNWKLAETLSKSYRVILAGGLTSQNVRLAMNTVHPFAVDVASGVEAQLGKKSSILMKEFLNEVNYVA